MLDKVTIYTDFTLCISFVFKRKVFKGLIFNILICKLVLSIFVCILEVFSYNKY